MRIGSCGTLSHERRRVRSMPIWAEASSTTYREARAGEIDMDRDEEEQFKQAAKGVLALTEKHLAELLKRGDFLEVKANE